MKKLLKGVLFVLVALVLLVVVALAAHPLWMGAAVRTVVGMFAPKYSGTPVVLTDCSVNLYGGHFELSGFDLSNPEGCSEKSAVRLGSLKADFDTLSALKDLIVVHNIEITGVFASYVKGASGKYNFTEIAENAKAAAGGQDEPAETTEAEDPEADKASGKKIVIERLSVGDVSLSMMGMKLPLIPGTVVLTDIGKESNGVALAQVGEQVWEQVMKAGGISGDGLSSLGKLGADIGIKGLDLGKKGVEVGTEGLKNAMESVKKLDVDGAKNVLKDTGKSLENVGKGLKGLFK